jgi:ComF family protein
VKLFLIKWKNFILDILFPPICLNCKISLTRNEYLCAACYNSIQLNTSLFCPVCRLRLAENKKICECAAVIIKNDKNEIEHQYSYILAAAGNYDDPVIRNLIHYFKYNSFENLTPILGEILLKYIKNCLPAGRHGKLKIENFVIVPIPLHRVKERQRGFNQSKLLAKYIAENFNLELADILKRTKNTKPQAQCKNNESRAKNIKNCFQIKNPADAEKIKNKNILLIDDVFTTGSTINEAVKILKQNGCGRIIALVAAKA